MEYRFLELSVVAAAATRQMASKLKQHGFWAVN
jgi:hypothetical protein